MEEKKDQDEQKENDYETVMDEQTGKTYKLVPEKTWDIVIATFSVLYLVVMLVIFTSLLFVVWAEHSFRESNPDAAVYLLMAYAAIGGALGGVVNGIRSFIIWHAERQAFGRRYVWKYITQPLLGVVLAAIVYALIRSGFVVFGGDLTPADNFTNQALVAFAVGALAGYGSHKVFKWLDGHVNRMFKVTSSVEVKVPELKGKTEQEARAALEEADLKLGEVSKEFSADPAVLDKVIRQNPPAGSMTVKGAAVNITIATR